MRFTGACAFLALAALASPVAAQQAQMIPTCGTASPPSGVSPTYMDANGNLCVAAGGGSALTPVVSAALEASHVLKATPGRLFSVYATNLTGAGSAFLLVLNATAKPGDGAVTPLVCVPFSGGLASANYTGVPPAAFSTGLTAVVSTGANCFTMTSSVATAFISGLVQ